MDKRQAVLTGALTVFARDGYARASIDVIAAEAAVSTRTIYNHFQDKAGLFRAVIQDSAARVAAAQLEIIDRYLRRITDLEADLVDFALAWRAPMPDYAEHSALVRQVNAEAGHIPQEAIQAWQETGPLAVRRALADRLAAFAADGLLEVDDPLRAALHFSLLVSGANPSYRGESLTTDEITEAVTTGVHAFLHGYGR
ncbi:TetR family transcriptional regulator [Kribbella orskensis]|uniref:TetR family transcriptional regulator n=1 Tax=Kribbella orskensis TaxID=2512216 RepID=A0ABY2BQD3_9ACTN|nr:MULTISPECIES: TetR/AcrR family transcriptional regulator [Kribbella]TCN39589.1 TetR family transcriptional regulator [Kribbella sp. VKM Ac-2500]TCO27629.1 TetR family transcriptional regulator [Kribbella orskensis]